MIGVPVCHYHREGLLLTVKMGNSLGRPETSISEQEHLQLCIYEIVEKIYPQDCQKITGMLLEVDHEELKELLANNREELDNRIHTAARVVNENHHSSAHTHDVDIIGNKVYGTVHQLYPTFADQITGMLLELGEERLCELLGNKDQFIDHIHKAGKVAVEMELNKKTRSYRDHNNSQDKMKDNKTSETVSIEEEQEKELLGCQIYLKIANQHPDTASKITGMLLEMNIESLREVNNDDDLLMKRVNQAVQALQGKEKSLVGEVEPQCNNDECGITKQQCKELLQKQLNLELNLSTLTKQLDGLEEDMQKELIGEELYKTLLNNYPNDAGHITGMLLEMDNDGLLETLSNIDLLQYRVEQAAKVLNDER